ncbi:MAG: hypothetical protein ACPGUC_07450, partial [Gammaproteobacteria bacterium]
MEPRTRTSAYPLTFPFLLSLLLASPVQAQDVFWDGTLGSPQDFATAGNWQGNTLPSPGDTAVFGLNGDQQVELSTNISVGAVRRDAGDLNLRVFGGATLSTQNGYDFSSDAGTTNALSIDGAGSAADLVGTDNPFDDLFIGGAGDSTLNIQNGAQVSFDNSIRVGSNTSGDSGLSGTLNVDGANSSLLVNNRISLGSEDNAGTLNITDQAGVF